MVGWWWWWWCSGGGGHWWWNWWTLARCSGAGRGGAADIHVTGGWSLPHWIGSSLTYRRVSGCLL
eukprot:scaffold53988_cov61-Phaeocystis_antarctica.AAC.2